jgi:diguanylate cyclase (GGDEF)-like protein/PAS domain S-box-containing protein
MAQIKRRIDDAEMKLPQILEQNNFIDLFPNPLIILRKSGAIIYVNSGFSDIISSNREDIIGKKISEIPLLNTLVDRSGNLKQNRARNSERFEYHNRYFEAIFLPFSHTDDQDLICIMLKDITDFIQLEKELVKRNKELIIISTLSRTFISSENMDLVIEDLLDKVLLITDFKIGWLLLKEDSSYRLRASRGLSARLQKCIEEGVLDSLCKEVAAMDEPLYIVEPSEISEVAVVDKEGITLLTAMPLYGDKKIIGFLFLARRDIITESFDFDTVALLSLIGNNISLILDKIKLFQETKRLSITDSLTGLFNRRHFYKHLSIEIARSKRYRNTFSVMLFDIDNFKKINDTYGHYAGDKVLMKISEIFRSVSRETDVIVRFGGEEFIIILPNTAEDAAFALANRIKQTVEETAFKINNRVNIRLTLSGGIASFPDNASDEHALLNAADQALYAAKASGKNKVLCFKDTANEKSIQKTSQS